MSAVKNVGEVGQALGDNGSEGQVESRKNDGVVYGRLVSISQVRARNISIMAVYFFSSLDGNRERTEVKGIEDPFVEQDNGGTATDPDTAREALAKHAPPTFYQFRGRLVRPFAFAFGFFFIRSGQLT